MTDKKLYEAIRGKDGVEAEADQLAAHQLLKSSASVDWFTPRKYLQSVRLVMGAIDLDPASCKEAQATVQAGAFWTGDPVDGLKAEWLGRVFCNPPYGRLHGRRGPSNQKLWLKKAIHEFRQGNVEQIILLINANTGQKFFQATFHFPICFTDHRIRFVPPADKGKKHQPTHGNAFIYMGPDVVRFAEHFQIHGRIWIPFRYWIHFQETITAAVRAGRLVVDRIGIGV